MTEDNDKSGSESSKYQRPSDGDTTQAADSVGQDGETAAPAADHAMASDVDETLPLETESEQTVTADSSDIPSDHGASDNSAASEPPAEPPAPVQKMPSRVPGYLGLLLGLAALGLAGYLYYLTQLQDPLAPFEARIDELASRAEANSGKVSTESDALRQEIEAAMASQNQAADSLRSELAAQQENLEAAQAALAESLGETISAQPPTDRDWKLAEAEYLLRIANHRLLMERDALTAGQLLTTADKILAELGDFSLFDVRTRLADEILSLKSLTGTDLQGLYLQLEALKNGIKALPPRLPEYLESSAPGLDADVEDVAEATADKELTVWQELGSRLSAFYQYRKIDGSETRRPLLSPDQATYLEMNLRLMLERAQLALMRRNQLVYEQSLSTAQEWIGEYLDTAAPNVVQAQSELAELLAVELELPVPDISGSLTALEAVSRGRDE